MARGESPPGPAAEERPTANRDPPGSSPHREQPAGTPGAKQQARTTEVVVVVEEKAWAGADVGKGFHWAHVVDAAGAELLSRRVDNDEADLIALIEEASADRFAAYVGLVPAAQDSGKRVGNHRKGRGRAPLAGNKVLKRVFYQSAFSSMRGVPESRAYYDRKRSQGKRHTQAVIALARRRVDVLWAMLPDGTTFETRSTA
jgi:hypothetical protein